LFSLNKGEKDILRSWGHDFKIELSESQIHLLGVYLAELCEWNRKMNLTGLYSRQTIITELLLDSLLPCPFLPEKGRLLDVGSGAGFPAIPIKICKPQLEAHLLEPNSKKVSFLKQAIRLLRIREIDVVRGRIGKDDGILHVGGYHIITARALAPLPQMLAWCVPHLLFEGLLVSFQGSQIEALLEESSDVIKKSRLFLYKSVPYTLPGRDSQRTLLIFRKREKEAESPALSNHHSLRSRG
jgi:16S rRNA (guanine527-N7)-methyltransferase